jgi:hypothetical protein
MLKIQARSRVPLEKVEARYGTHATKDDYDVLLTGDCKVYGPKGELICVYLKGALDEELAEEAYPSFHSLRTKKSDNRGNYAGQSKRAVAVKEDGTASSTLRSKSVRSSIIGYFDRYPRIPFCRQTAFTAKEVDKWESCLGLVRQVSELFKQHIPARYKAQKDFVDNLSQDFVIDGSVYTTVTVNNCTAAAAHQDKGDLKAGFGALACLRKGNYTGSELVFLQYRIAVDLHDRDLLFFDPHLWHANVEFEDFEGPETLPEKGGWERISLVFYVREKMQECGSAAEEAERAKRHATGGAIE